MNVQVHLAIPVTSPDKVGGGRMEPSATFGRGHRRDAHPTSPRFARGGDRRRGGYVFVLFALLLFGLMAMAALVIDLGIARVTQRKMQSASDGAALEGLRGKGAFNFHYEIRQLAAEKIIELQLSDFEPLKGNETSNDFRVSIQRGGVLDVEADVFAGGRSVPFLFAHGSLAHRTSLENGIATRSLSIAQPRPALKVGLPVTGASGTIFPGAIAIGYELTDWNTTKSSPLMLDSAKTVVGQPVMTMGSATSLPDGYCSILGEASGRRVVGFGWIEKESPIAQNNVAPGNAVSRLSEVWDDIDPSIRPSILAQNASLIHSLTVSTTKVAR